MEDLTFTDRKALAKCEVLACCISVIFFAKSYTLGNWISLEPLGYKVTTKKMKEEGEKLLPVGGERGRLRSTMLWRRLTLKITHNLDYK